jgi:glucosamine 6-phosphate synthetase-like amidotransferase/phosphosugar isomerase protein
MCGIAGSNNKDRSFKLYQSNLNRGHYSSGALILNKDNQPSIRKVLGVYNAPITESVPENYYLYHSRGPTVETSQFIPEDNHPFSYGDWIVAHNGIISNFKELCIQYFPQEDFTGKTDSCIIPRMLEENLKISTALEELEGTFAIWMYNKKFKRTYLARSANTLFANMYNGDFSSTEFERSLPLDEGIIYAIQDYETIVPVAEFRSNSPYFFI